MPNIDFSKFIAEQPIDEKLDKEDPSSKWIHDFVKSKNPKFEGKTKKERIKMALGAYYSKQRNEEAEQVDEMDSQGYTRDGSVLGQMYKSRHPLKLGEGLDKLDNKGGWTHIAHTLKPSGGGPGVTMKFKADSDEHAKELAKEKAKKYGVRVHRIEKINEEQVDELKISTLLRYATKANKSLINGDREKENKRIKGIQTAISKLTKRGVLPNPVYSKEEVDTPDEVNELKSSTLRSYAGKVQSRMKDRYTKLMTSGGDVEDYNKQAKKDLSNVNKALDKAAKKTMVPSQARYEEVESVEEAKHPSKMSTKAIKAEMDNLEKKDYDSTSKEERDRHDALAKEHRYRTADAPSGYASGYEVDKAVKRGQAKRAKALKAAAATSEEVEQVEEAAPKYPKHGITPAHSDWGKAVEDAKRLKKLRVGVHSLYNVKPYVHAAFVGHLAKAVGYKPTPHMVSLKKEYDTAEFLKKRKEKEALKRKQKNEEVEDTLNEAHKPGFVAIAVNPNQSDLAKQGKRYTVFFKADRVSPRGHTKPKDISHHETIEDAKAAKAAYVKLHASHGVKALKGLGEEMDQIDEISQDLKTAYTQKAKAQVKELQPFAKKRSEYRDIAKNLIAKRQAGLAKANEEAEETIDEAVVHDQYDQYHAAAVKKANDIIKTLDKHKKAVYQGYSSNPAETKGLRVGPGHVMSMKEFGRTLQDMHDRLQQDVESCTPPEPINIGKK